MNYPVSSGTRSEGFWVTPSLTFITNTAMVSCRLELPPLWILVPDSDLQASKLDFPAATPHAAWKCDPHTQDPV